jgi:hypothetical protein
MEAGEPRLFPLSAKWSIDVLSAVTLEKETEKRAYRKYARFSVSFAIGQTSSVSCHFRDARYNERSYFCPFSSAASYVWSNHVFSRPLTFCKLSSRIG